MQMNVYIPKEKESLIQKMSQAASSRGCSKNELVLEALERYLIAEQRLAELQTFQLGEIRECDRDDLYQGRVKP